MHSVVVLGLICHHLAFRIQVVVTEFQAFVIFVDVNIAEVVFFNVSVAPAPP